MGTVFSTSTQPSTATDCTPKQAFPTLPKLAQEDMANLVLEIVMYGIVGSLVEFSSSISVFTTIIPPPPEAPVLKLSEEPYIYDLDA